MSKDQNLMYGLALPSDNPVKGNTDPQVREQWISVVAVLMARGVTTVAAMQRCLTKPDGYMPRRRTVKNWMQVVASRYSVGLSRAEVEAGRGALLAELEQVKAVAWHAVGDLMTNGVEVVTKSGAVQRVSGSDKIAPLLSQIISANKQAATLYGLDKLKIDVRSINANLDVTKVVEVATKHGIPAAALRNLGSNLARLISEGGDDEQQK